MSQSIRRMCRLKKDRGCKKSSDRKRSSEQARNRSFRFFIKIGTHATRCSAFLLRTNRALGVPMYAACVSQSYALALFFRSDSFFSYPLEFVKSKDFFFFSKRLTILWKMWYNSLYMSVRKSLMEVKKWQKRINSRLYR